MYFRMFYLCGLHTSVLKIDLKKNKSIMENLKYISHFFEHQNSTKFEFI